MGLLDFAKDVGSRLFTTDADAAENIKQHLDIKVSGIENLRVGFDDGVATLGGECINEKTRDTCILIAGNVKGVERVVADDLVFPEPEEKQKVEYYEIVSGDTLGAIAKKYYGKASLYTKIHEANKELIPDPNKIYPGQKIRIPLD